MWNFLCNLWFFRFLGPWIVKTVNTNNSKCLLYSQFNYIFENVQCKLKINWTFEYVVPSQECVRIIMNESIFWIPVKTSSVQWLPGKLVYFLSKTKKIYVCFFPCCSPFKCDKKRTNLLQTKVCLDCFVVAVLKATWISLLFIKKIVIKWFWIYRFPSNSVEKDQKKWFAPNEFA